MAKKSENTMTPEMRYQLENPGAGGSASQQGERAKKNPTTTQDEGGAALPGGSNDDLKGPKPDRGPRGAGT
jgi:hypothetical protein